MSDKAQTTNCQHVWKRNDHEVIKWICKKCGGWTNSNPKTETTKRADGNSRLVAQNRKINKHHRFESGPVNASFKKSYINTDGDIGRVVVSAGNSLVEMTYPQAVALANEILRRCL